MTACQPSDSGKASSQTVQSVDKIQLQSLILVSEQPYVVVNFYTTDCRPCRQEIPELISMQNDPNQDARVLFVSLDERPSSQPKLAQKLHTYLAGLGYQEASYHYNIDSAKQFIEKVYPNWNHSIPLNLIYANNGRLVDKTGITDKSELELIINEDKSFYTNELSP